MIWTSLKFLRQLAIAFCLVLCLFNLPFLVPAGIAQTSTTAAYRSRLEIVGDRLDELKSYVDANNWITIKTYIHGPLGQVRVDISRSIRDLKKQAPAKAAAQKFYDDLVQIDVAATARNADKSLDAYEKALQDFDNLVEILKKV